MYGPSGSAQPGYPHFETCGLWNDSDLEIVCDEVVLGPIESVATATLCIRKGYYLSLYRIEDARRLMVELRDRMPLRYGDGPNAVHRILDNLAGIFNQTPCSGMFP